MQTDELELRRKFAANFRYFATNALKIRTKDGAIKPFSLNSAQLYLHKQLQQQLRETGKIRALVLKGRQQGVSTYTEARFYWRVIHRKGTRAFILTHEQEATNNLFDMVSRYHEHNLPQLKPDTAASNAKELLFSSLDSGYKVGTAGNKAVGRSSTVQLFHGSEVAFWPHASEHSKGIMQAIPDAAGTEVILESTANGIGNYFYQQCMAAQSGETDYQLVFLPWYWQPEYRAETTGLEPTPEEHELAEFYGLDRSQLAWRRKKIAELSVGGTDGVHSFRQEYPFSVTEAFQVSDTDSLIKSAPVLAARMCGETDPHALVCMGVDPARFGKDSTAIVVRQGREVLSIEKFQKLDTMQSVGKIIELMQIHRPARIFIDDGGLGAGVVDRMKELGYDDIVTGVQFGGTPISRKEYSNKRAEMWGEMNKWIQDTPCNLPDDDELHGDLTAPKYKYDSNGALVLEKKDDIKERLGRSPDLGDALALTFAFPVRRSITFSNQRQHEATRKAWT